ncbi:tetratricopeptide repeat protein [Helicobacter baculiformis]|uniref:beta-lactamase n=1 Tax=Helicobacter baculiformis TaxID=427351 RepID=A0ABV7ZHG3_9HELI|nr:tetratricopeptide repeat protein [Helicobacter baculiformis]
MKTKMKFAACVLGLGAGVLGAKQFDPQECGVKMPGAGYFAYGTMRGAVSTGLSNLGLSTQDAIACFKVAAQAGIYTAYTDLGNLYQQAKQYKKALEAYQKAADKGDDAAMIQLGTMYSSGLGVAKDYHKAFKYFEKASLKWNVAGLVELGVMYEYGLGVKKDYAKAMEYYQKGKTDNKGNMALGAYVQIGHLYFEGLGVKKDYAQAMDYLKQVSTSDNKEVAREANRMLGSIFEKGGYGVEQDISQAQFYYKEGAKAGDQESKKDLIGLLNAEAKKYQDGQDYENALKLYQEVANAGDPDGYVHIGLLYIGVQGKKVPNKP